MEPGDATGGYLSRDPPPPKENLQEKLFKAHEVPQRVSQQAILKG
jgi:hypothetical protein